MDPHGLAPWVNEIGQLHRTSTAMEDPHELASWVNEIPGCRTRQSHMQSMDPQELRVLRAERVYRTATQVASDQRSEDFTHEASSWGS